MTSWSRSAARPRAHPSAGCTPPADGRGRRPAPRAPAPAATPGGVPRRSRTVPVDLAGAARQRGERGAVDPAEAEALNERLDAGGAEGQDAALLLERGRIAAGPDPGP